LPANTGDVVRAYRNVLVPEMNSGQLVRILRAEFLVDAKSFSKVQGLPIFAEELEQELFRMVR
jgi:2-oxoglutarate ferredoxin oxidoreductase subunit alpha